MGPLSGPVNSAVTFSPLVFMMCSLSCPLFSLCCSGSQRSHVLHRLHLLDAQNASVLGAHVSLLCLLLHVYLGLVKDIHLRNVYCTAILPDLKLAKKRSC